MHAIFAAIGFAVVLLPILSRSWRAIIESTPLVRVVFHDYSTFGGLAMANLYILMALFLIRNWQIKSLPGGGCFFSDLQKRGGYGAFPENEKRRICVLG